MLYVLFNVLTENVFRYNYPYIAIFTILNFPDFSKSAYILSITNVRVISKSKLFGLMDFPRLHHNNKIFSHDRFSLLLKLGAIVLR